MDKYTIIQRQRGIEAGHHGNCTKSVLVAWPIIRRRHDETTTSGLKNGATRPVTGNTMGQERRRRSTVPNETGRAKELCDRDLRRVTRRDVIRRTNQIIGETYKQENGAFNNGAYDLHWGLTGRRDI